MSIGPISRPGNRSCVAPSGAGFQGSTPRRARHAHARNLLKVHLGVGKANSCVLGGQPRNVPAGPPEYGAQVAVCSNLSHVWPEQARSVGSWRRPKNCDQRDEPPRAGTENAGSPSGPNGEPAQGLHAPCSARKRHDTPPPTVRGATSPQRLRRAVITQCSWVNTTTVGNETPPRIRPQTAAVGG